MKKVNMKILSLTFLLFFVIVVVSMVGCSKTNLPGGSSGLPVYPNSKESSDFNMWATITGFSNQFTEFYSYPFYYVVGIVGDDYTAVKKGKYGLTLYLVYPRYYPFKSFYVYIADYKLK